MDTKDFICPPSLKFNKSDFEIGNAYGAVWGMNILAGELPDEILKDFLIKQKYDKLCKEYDELQSEYNEMLDYYNED
ncbi:hypothetical protein [Ruminococcus flavefaciens]|uniref:hypothetical protein n=1 Tax=Ruminococcus flavefaciens TaxID=1265 RepID=UPI003F05B6C6